MATSNTTIIILGVILLVLVYYLYYYFTTPTALIKSVYLNTSNPPISVTSMSSPLSANYSYSVWVYVNTWNNTNEKLLFSRGPDTSPTGISNSDFILYLDVTEPTLWAQFSSSNPKQINPPIQITTDFEIQKWVQLIVSVGGQFVDFYLDGKLVSSVKLNNVPVITSTPINFGTNSDIYLNHLLFTPSQTDPQSAWNSYLAGNGMSTNSYHGNFTLLQNNTVQSVISLF